MIYLSIIIPVYNRENYIMKCINSIQMINSKQIEIIIIDDGSQDRSLEICQQLMKNDSRIKLVSQQNAGVSSARNLGLKNASGKYIMFVDSDDMVLSETINYFLSMDTESDIYLFDYYMIDSICNKYCTRETENTVIDIFLKRKSNMIWNNIYKADVIKKRGLRFQEKMKMGEDLIFNLNFALAARNFCYIKKPLYVYNMKTIGSAMNVYRTSYVANYLYIFDFLKKNKLRVNPEDYLGVIFNNLVLSDYINEIEMYQRVQNSDWYQSLTNVTVKSVKNKFKSFVIKHGLFRYIVFRKIMKKMHAVLK